MINTLWKTCAVCAIFIASHLPPWSAPARLAGETAHGREMSSDSDSLPHCGTSIGNFTSSSVTFCSPVPPPPTTARRGPIPAPTHAGRDRPLFALGLTVLCDAQGRADLRNLCDLHLLSPPPVVGPSGNHWGRGFMLRKFRVSGKSPVQGRNRSAASLMLRCV